MDEKRYTPDQVIDFLTIPPEKVSETIIDYGLIEPDPPMTEAEMYAACERIAERANLGPGEWMLTRGMLAVPDADW